MAQKYLLAIIIALATLATSVATILLISKRNKEKEKEEEDFYNEFKDEWGTPDGYCSDE